MLWSCGGAGRQRCGLACARGMLWRRWGHRRAGMGRAALKAAVQRGAEGVRTHGGRALWVLARRDDGGDAMVHDSAVVEHGGGAAPVLRGGTGAAAECEEVLWRIQHESRKRERNEEAARTLEHGRGDREGRRNVAVSCAPARTQNVKGHGEGRGRTTCSNFRRPTQWSSLDAGGCGRLCNAEKCRDTTRTR